MSKHLSIHTSQYHNAFRINLEENKEIIDIIYFIEKFVYPLDDKDCYYLYDFETKEVLAKSNDIATFELDSNTEILSLTGVPLEEASVFKIPQNINCLVFEGGGLIPFHMGKSDEGFALWQEVINWLNLYKLIENIDERLTIEKELRNIYNNELPKHIIDYELSRFLEKIEISNIVKLTIAFTYFSDIHFKKLSKLKNLQELEILYCYNDNIRYLPENITYLKIFGNTIQNLSEINLKLTRLLHLNLNGNAINNLDNLTELPNKLQYLILSDNLIKNINISQLPKKLHYLDLSKNLIENEFFSQKTVHRNVKFLKLSQNNIIVTTSILHLLLDIFPNLEYLELFDNKTYGVPVDFLGNSEDKNCLELVEFYLEGIDFRHNGGELNISNTKNLIHFVEVNWIEQSLPINVILSHIQTDFSQYFEKVPSFNQFMNGLYCFIEHDNCEIFIKCDEDKKQVNFRVQSDKSEKVSTYFHKYFHDIHDIICFNSHFDFLPYIISSKSCDFLKDFHSKVFKLNYNVKKDVVLKSTNNGIDVLINNRKIENEDEDVKLPDAYYENIKNIGFILISGKSGYPFIIKDGVLTNSFDIHRNFHYYLTLRNATEKENFINGITNKYLNDSGLEEVEIFIDNDVRKKVSCFINPNLFHANAKILSLKNPKFPELKDSYLKDVKMENDKWCEFNIGNNIIELKYVF